MSDPIENWINVMAAFQPMRVLAVAHQTWGECQYCDRRFDQMVKAALEAGAKISNCPYTGEEWAHPEWVND